MSRVSMVSWRICAAVLLLSGLFSTGAYAWFEGDDFEGGPDGGFNNPFFNHDVGVEEFGGVGPMMWGFDISDSVSPTHSLLLSPATDYITFNPHPGDYVDYAEVWMRTTLREMPAILHVIGWDRLGARLEYFEETPDDDLTWSEWHLADTAGAGFGEITEIRLTGYAKGLFDDLNVNVVPEPATLGMLGVGLVGFVWSRTRQRRA